MNNRIISIVIVSLLVIGGFIGILSIVPEDVEAPGPTYVSGLITINTTWTEDNSPYIISSDTTLKSGYTLTIEAGTVVKFAENTVLRIRGPLYVNGVNNKRVIFTANDTLKNYTMDFYEEAELKYYYYNGTGSNFLIFIENFNGGIVNISYAKFEFSSDRALAFAGGNYDLNVITDSIFENNKHAIEGVENSQISIERCKFQNNWKGLFQAYYKYTINNSQFVNNSLGAEHSPCNIYNSSFIGNDIGIYAGGSEIKNSLFINNDIGTTGDIFLSNNSIANNRIGVIFKNHNIKSPILYNNIYNNSDYNFKLNYGADFFIPYNWWGTTNTSIIDQYIYDIYDDVSLGEAFYVPFLTGPVGQKSARLKQGCNLISIPLIQPDESIDKVLSSIAGEYYALQWYDASDGNDPWKHHHTSKPPHLNDLKQINHTMALYIYMNQPGDTVFFFNGTEPTENQKILLHPGWNLVGYPSKSDKPRDDALNSLTFDTHVDSILTYNSATQKWKELGPSDYFEVGSGYWIHAMVGCEWEVPL